MSRLKNVAEILIENRRAFAYCLIFRYVRIHVIKIIIPPRLMIFFLHLLFIKKTRRKLFWGKPFSTVILKQKKADYKKKKKGTHYVPSNKKSLQSFTCF